MLGCCWTASGVVSSDESVPAYTIVLFSLPSAVSLCGRGLFFVLDGVYAFVWRRVCTVHLAARW